MNELLNRWRYGEVNLLQRKFRVARAQSVKHTIASKILGTLTAPSSTTGTATSVATSANRDTSFAEDGLGGDKNASPTSRDGGGGDGGGSGVGGAKAELSEGKKGAGVGEGSTLGTLASKTAGGGSEVGGVVSLGDVVRGRVGMDKEAFLRVFPDLQVIFFSWFGGHCSVCYGPVEI